MTDKEKIELKDGVINIFNRFNTLDNTATIGGLRDDILRYIDSLQEELVIEYLNTESMIESYKQRLISQANGVKNSPLIDMCLASYKHGINETLGTLNLSNVQRTLNNWEKPKFKVGDRIKFKGIHNEDVTRVITDIKEGEGVGFRYFFADGSIYSIGDDEIELVEDHAILTGMNKMEQQMMAKAIDGVITFDYYDSGDKTYGCVAHDSFCLEDFGLKDKDKVKVIVIKED